MSGRGRWGLYTGGEGWRAGGERKGVVRQAMQTLCSGGNIRKALAHFPSQGRGKKREEGFAAAAPVNKEPRFAHRLSKMSSTEATPDGMVGAQHKELKCSFDNMEFKKTKTKREKCGEFYRAQAVLRIKFYFCHMEGFFFWVSNKYQSPFNFNCIKNLEFYFIFNK